MIVGNNHHRLERRITAALLSGVPYPREAYFLQQMSERILHWGKNTFLSHLQATRLFAILARCEKKPSLPPASTPLLPKTQNRQPRKEELKPLHIKKSGVDPHAALRSPTQPNRIAFPTPAPPAQQSGPSAPDDKAIEALFKRVFARNENFRKRRERIERQRLKSLAAQSINHGSIKYPPR